jgi:hypothetical protein
MPAELLAKQRSAYYAAEYRQAVTADREVEQTQDDVAAHEDAVEQPEHLTPHG